VNEREREAARYHVLVVVGLLLVATGLWLGVDVAVGGCW
jgi:hypothetical protein